MKPLTLLEVVNLDGLIIIIILIILFVAVSVSFMVTTIIKVWYEWKEDKKFSRKQFIQTMIICLLVCGLISGYICGGGL